MNFTLFSMNCTFFSRLSHCFMNFTSRLFMIFSMYSYRHRDVRQNLTNFMLACTSITHFSHICALVHEVHVVFHQFHVFFRARTGIPAPNKRKCSHAFSRRFMPILPIKKTAEWMPLHTLPYKPEWKVQIVSDNPSRAKNN